MNCIRKAIFVRVLIYALVAFTAHFARDLFGEWWWINLMVDGWLVAFGGLHREIFRGAK